MTGDIPNNDINSDDKLNELFNAAAKEEWQPFNGFSNRVLARIEHEESSTVLIDRIAWRILPFTAAASLATAVVAAMGDSIQSVIYSTISDPFAIEQIIALISG